MIDAHCHLQSERLGKNLDGLLAEARSVGVRGWVCCGTHPRDWDAVAAVAEQGNGSVKPAYGLHPWYVTEANPGWFDELRARLDADPKAVVGETGLDGWEKEPEAQRQAFEQQLELAVELDRTLCVHCVREWGTLMAVLRSQEMLPPFVVHAYGGSIEIAAELAQLGGLVSFSGLICRSNATRMRAVAAAIPDDAILVETDSPDLCPEAKRPGPCVPADLAHVVRELAALRGISVETAAAITESNARRVFRWSPA